MKELLGLMLVEVEETETSMVPVAAGPSKDPNVLSVRETVIDLDTYEGIDEPWYHLGGSHP